jgi:23S rRNA pseudouridine1911/1915/1917 synthase
MSDFLKRKLGFSSSLVTKVKFGGVSLNGEVVTMRATVKNGDTVEIDFPEEESENVTPMDIPLDILYEDEHILVADKPRNMPTHPSKGNSLPTLANAVSAIMDENFVFRAVNRLDRDTSGLMIYAKHVKTQRSFIEGWQALVTDRTYVALAEGRFEKSTDTVKSWLTEDKHFITHSSPVNNGGKYAVTHYNVLRSTDNYSLVELELETGRKNQIRVHLADLGHPIVGDFKYGSSDERLGRLGLHAYALAFRHPVTGKFVRFETPIPDSFEKVMRADTGE